MAAEQQVITISYDELPPGELVPTAGQRFMIAIGGSVFTGIIGSAERREDRRTWDLVIAPGTFSRA